MKRVVDVALCCDGKVLLCLEQVAHSPGELYWIPPGGKIEPGEDDFAAICRELEEELGITSAMLAERGIIPRRYCEHRGDWHGDQIVVQHFIAKLDEPLPFKLLVGQRDSVWTSVPPSGGSIPTFTETLMIYLELGGYLYQ